MMIGKKAPAGKPRRTRSAAPAGVNPLPSIETTRALLFPYQRAWVENTSRFMAGVWGRQTGKSFATACIVAESMVRQDNTTWMIAAPSERQSLEALAKVKEWIRALGVVFSDYLEQLQSVQEKAAAVSLPNGSRCIAVPGKPDTVRGMSCNVWLDEFAFFERPDETWKAILPSITNPLRGGEKRCIITSTPNGMSGQGARFYSICAPALGLTSASSGSLAWSVHHNPLRKAIAEGLPVDYDALAAAIGDPLAVRQELDAEFVDTAGQLLPTALILRAESEEATMHCPLSLYAPGAHGAASRDLRIGIDIGRMSDPTVLWTVERLGGILVTREILVLANVSHADQLTMIAARARGASRVCLDYTGLGIGIGDMLVRDFGEYKPEAHKFGKIERCTFSPKLKQEIFPRLREEMEAVRLRIPRDEALRSDLSAMSQVVTAGGYSYEAPRTREGHSDRCTAAALAVRAAAGSTYVPRPARIPLGKKPSRRLRGGWKNPY